MTSEPGVGSIVTLDLPYRPSLDKELMSSEPVSTQDDRPSTAASLTIMVVDDVEMNREFVQIALGREGHAVTALSSGEAAIDALKEGTVFDLILMDVQMPIMDGLTATRAIRALPGPAHTTPIIGLTANALPEQVAACRDAGMDDHLSKPVDLGLLVERVKAVCERRNLAPMCHELATATGPDDALTALSRRYAEHLKTLPGEADRLCAMPLDERAQGLANLAHSVAGTAGSLGFPELSAAAFDLEDCAKQVISGDAAAASLETATRIFLGTLDTAKLSH